MNGDIGLNTDARTTIDKLSTNIESMVRACVQLSERAVRLEKRIAEFESRMEELYAVIDEDLGPALAEMDEKLTRIDGVATSIIEASKESSGSKRMQMISALEKIREIFDFLA